MALYDATLDPKKSSYWIAMRTACVSTYTTGMAKLFQDTMFDKYDSSLYFVDVSY